MKSILKLLTLISLSLFLTACMSPEERAIYNEQQAIIKKKADELRAEVQSYLPNETSVDNIHHSTDEQIIYIDTNEEFYGDNVIKFQEHLYNLKNTGKIKDYQLHSYQEGFKHSDDYVAITIFKK